MKTGNQKGKTTVPSKKAAAKKKTSRTTAPRLTSGVNKTKPGGKPAKKAVEKEKKVLVSRKVEKPHKTVKKSSAKPAKAGPPVTKKKEARPRAVKETIKKILKTAPKTTGKKASEPKVTKKASPKNALKAARKKASSPEKKPVSKTAKDGRDGTRKKKIAEAKKEKTTGDVLSRVKASGPIRKIAGIKKALIKKAPLKDTQGKKPEDLSGKTLPAEYGEDEVILMAVDPNVIFVDWEIKKEKIPGRNDNFTMRVFDVTDHGQVGAGPDIFFDLKIEGSEGAGFFEIRMPGRDVAIEIGAFDSGQFLPLLQSSTISMPRLVVPDELGIAQKLFDSGIPVGY